jgi:hypothetical protein
MEATSREADIVAIVLKVKLSRSADLDATCGECHISAVYVGLDLIRC